MHYNWNRYYDPATGRYISADPIGFYGGDLNLYSYVWQDPVNWSDRLGLSAKFHNISPTKPWSMMLEAGGPGRGIGGGYYGGGARRYVPDRVLPRSKHGDPIPDANCPHSQLGRSPKKYGNQPQAREWDYGDNGKLIPKRDIDFTDHNFPKIHPNPHQHTLTPNNPSLAPKGGFLRGDPEPLIYP